MKSGGLCNKVQESLGHITVSLLSSQDLLSIEDNMKVLDAQEFDECLAGNSECTCVI